MKLSKFCDETLVEFDLKSKDKSTIIDELVELVGKSNMVTNQENLLADIKERENLVTTGVGYGVAFPHAKTKAVKGIVIAFGRSEAGIDFDAMDHRPVHLFFSYVMKSEENREKLRTASSPGDVLALMDNVD